jgi:hypothetical protein
MALDAFPGGAIDTTQTVAGPNAFNVDIVVVDAGPGFQLYQFTVKWDPQVLAYDSQVDLTPEQLSLCAVPTARADTVFGGCGRVRGNTSFVGPTNRLTFRCAGQGTSTLHLVTLAEDPGFGSTLLGFNGLTIPTSTSDVSVQCTG